MTEGRRLETVLFDFTDPRSTRQWETIDDVVMGGRSSSSVRIEDGRLIFEGDLSLENDGGFCSTRSRTEGWDLSGFQGLVVTISGDGRKYSLTLQTERGRDAVIYQHPLPVSEGSWETVHAHFADFEPTYHGEVLEDAPAVEQSHVYSVGFIIADGREGPFRLRVERIAAYAAP